MADRGRGGTPPEITVRRGMPRTDRDAGAAHVDLYSTEEAVTPAVTKLTDFFGTHF